MFVETWVLSVLQQRAGGLRVFGCYLGCLCAAETTLITDGSIPRCLCGGVLSAIVVCSGSDKAIITMGVVGLHVLTISHSQMILAFKESRKCHLLQWHWFGPLWLRGCL